MGVLWEVLVLTSATATQSGQDENKDSKKRKKRIIKEERK
jgi:hypothetical protein